MWDVYSFTIDSETVKSILYTNIVKPFILKDCMLPMLAITSSSSSSSHHLSHQGEFDSLIINVEATFLSSTPSFLTS